MRGEELLNRMDLVDPAYVEAADGRAKKRSRGKWGAAAACLCLFLIGGTTVLAAMGWGTRLVGLFPQRTDVNGDLCQSGYDLNVEIERVPLSDLSEEVRSAEDTIARQFENYKPHMSWYPGHWQREFPTAREAGEFIGFGPLKLPDWDLREEGAVVNVYGDPEISEVSMEADYRVGEIRLYFFASLYTENYRGEISTGSRTLESISFTESFHLTGSGKKCHVITASALDSGYLCKDAYVVDGGVLYQLHIAYLQKDEDGAEARLRQWMEQY